jgi:Tfp pilus assembly protein PilX
MIVRRPSVNTDHRRRGSALVMTSVIVMLAAGMGAAMLHVQSGMSARHREMADRRRAFYVAEAGLSESFLAIASG